MSLFLKWLGASLLCALPFWLVIDLATPKQATEGLSLAGPISRVEERFGAVASATRRLFTAQVSQNPIGDSFYASDPAHLAARDRYLKSLFTPDRGNHTFQTVEQGRPVAYEIRGLTLVGPRAQPVDDAARLLGIEVTLMYRYRAEAHRRILENEAAASWTPGVPAGLDGFLLVRQGGQWSARDLVGR